MGILKEKIDLTLQSKAAFDAKMTEIGITPPSKFIDYAERVAAFDGYDVQGTSTYVGIPASVTSVRKYVLSGMVNVHSLTVPSTVVTFNANAFSNSSLTDVTMTGRTRGQTVSIVNFAFGLGDDVTFHCTDGTFAGARYIASGTTTLPSSHFKGNTTVKMCVLPDTCTSTGTSSYMNCTALTTAYFPANFKTVGASTFNGCTALTTVVPNASMTTISSSAFLGCTALPSYTCNASLSSIGSSAFKNCTALTSFKCNNALTSIGNSAFYGCDHLTSFTFGTGATTIGQTAFSYCTALKSLTIPSTVPSTGIGANALQSSGLENVTLSGRTMDQAVAMTNYPWGLTAWSNKFTCTDGKTYGDGWKWGNAVASATPTKSGTTLTIGPTVGKVAANAYTGDTTIFDIVNNSYCLTEIGANAFKNCSMITGYTASPSDTHDRQNVYSIGNNAFEGCSSLSSFSYARVRAIGTGAFKGCVSLPSVDTSSSASIGESAFENCTSLASVTYGGTGGIGDLAFKGCSALTSMTANNTTGVGNYAFQNCSALTSISLTSATSVGNYAFNGCSALASVSLPACASVGEWAFASGLHGLNLSNIKIGSSSPGNIIATTIGYGAFRNINFNGGNISSSSMSGSFCMEPIYTAAQSGNYLFVYSRAYEQETVNRIIPSAWKFTTEGTIGNVTLSNTPTLSPTVKTYDMSPTESARYLKIWIPYFADPTSSTERSQPALNFLSYHVRNYTKIPLITKLTLPNTQTIQAYSLGIVNVDTVEAPVVSVIEGEIMSTFFGTFGYYSEYPEVKASARYGRIGHLKIGGIISSMATDCLKGVSEVTFSNYTMTQVKSGISNYPWGLSNGVSIHCKDGTITVGS